MTIRNAKNINLNKSFGNLPDMSSAMLSWFRPMVFSIITKETINYKTVETKVDQSFGGTWQPQSSSQINRKPEGQRSWKWFQVHTDTALGLVNDDLINYLGKSYRIKGYTDYSEYGYYYYELIEDYI